jgi:hypothetical protein
MSFGEMVARLRGEVPGISSILARNQINEALSFVYDSRLWSFQLKYDGWLTPGLIGSNGAGQSTGTITVDPYTNTITGDADASALWTGLTGRPLLTELQIRIPYYSLYNIIAVDDSVPTAVVLTIDRPWMEPTQVNAAYMLYQAYFPAPVSDFKRFFAVRDTRNNAPMNFWKYSQKDLQNKDPQRTDFNLPRYVIAYGHDQRPSSATLGNMLYELWPHPLSQLPYTFTYLRRGPVLTSRADEVPYPLDDECVLWRAKELAYLWKEAQRPDGMSRGSGADNKFLSQAAYAMYEKKIKTIRDRDRDLAELLFNRFVRNPENGNAPFATINGDLSVGGWEGG